MRIWVVHPIVTAGFCPEVQEMFRQHAHPHTIDSGFLEAGPRSIEGEFDEAFAAPGVIKAAIEAERRGYDAVIVNCMGDPGLKPAREAVEIPVFAPCEASTHIAAILGERFSIVTTSESGIPLFERLVRGYGLEGKLASVRCIDIPVLALPDSPEQVGRIMGEVAERAVREDGASVIIPGCTALTSLVDAIKQQLDGRYPGISVVDPVASVVKLTIAMLEMGQRMSRRSYAKAHPFKDHIVGYGS